MFFSQLSEWLVCRGRRKRVWVVITLVILLLGVRTNRAGINFESEIAPLIAKRCLECHNQSDAKGGLNLTSKAGLDKGGDSGGVVTPGSESKVTFCNALRRVKCLPNHEAGLRRFLLGRFNFFSRGLKVAQSGPKVGLSICTK